MFNRYTGAIFISLVLLFHANELDAVLLILTKFQQVVESLSTAPITKGS